MRQDQGHGVAAALAVLWQWHRGGANHLRNTSIIPNAERKRNKNQALVLHGHGYARYAFLFVVCGVIMEYSPGLGLHSTQLSGLPRMVYTFTNLYCSPIYQHELMRCCFPRGPAVATRRDVAVLRFLNGTGLPLVFRIDLSHT